MAEIRIDSLIDWLKKEVQVTMEYRHTCSSLFVSGKLAAYEGLLNFIKERE